MIITSIYIDGFGIFNNFSLENLQGGINLISGNNETGKSTLLKFLRYTLFGYPRAIEERMPPLNGGNHGGRIVAIHSDGNEAVFERYSGVKGGPTTLNYDGRTYDDQNQWLLLLGNANNNLYDNVYAFSLEELINIDSLKASGVEDKIFSLGLGLGRFSIGDAESNIHKKIESIYIPRGGVQEIPKILDGIQFKSNRIHKIQDNLPRYNELVQTIEMISGEVREIEDEVNELRKEKDKLKNYIKCYESFLTINNIDEELQTLPELQDYPEDGTDKLTGLEHERKSLNDKISDLKNGSVDEKGIIELENEMTGISYNSSLLEQEEKVEYISKNLELYKTTIADKKEAEEEILKLEKSIKDELKKINGDWTEKHITGFSDSILHKNRIEEFRKRFGDIENTRRDLKAREGILSVKIRLAKPKTIAAIIAFIFMAGSIPFFIYSLYAAGIAFSLISLILFFGKKYLQERDPLEEVREQLSGLDKQEENIKTSYQEYLNGELHLDTSLSIETVLEIFRLIEGLQKDINTRNEIERKQTQQRIPFINKFEKEVFSILEMTGLKISPDNLEVAADQLTNEFYRDKQESKKEKDLQANLNRENKELDRTKEKLKANQGKIKQLLETINAADRENFRKKCRDNDSVKKLINDKKNEIKNIETVVGMNKSGEVTDVLSFTDKPDIVEKIQTLENEISLKSEELNIKNKELGEKINERRSIEGESELAEAMTELETEKEKLNNAYREWLAGKVALNVLAEVKGKFEKEKQPAVIQNSSKYFSNITNERYNRIHVSLNEKEVAVFDSREASKKIEQLSRGTKEQLLISLRLGFIEEYEKKAEPLPVIMDEVLVNFDPPRAKKTAEILYEFGRNRQVLIFTCHSSTLQYFKGLNINCCIIKENGLIEYLTTKDS